MTLKELEPQLLALSATEKSQAIQLIFKSLLNSWHGIEKTSDVCGGDACIRDTRIPIWLLVSYQKKGLNDAKILEAYPDLNAVDLANAWIYAESHPQEITTAILENEVD